jgi:hypothetical protein
VPRVWAGLAAAWLAVVVVTTAARPGDAAGVAATPRERTSSEAQSRSEGHARQSSPAPVTPSAPMLGFDTCETPSVAEMSAWKGTSPFGAVGIYIGGAARHCPNPALDLPAGSRPSPRRDGG